MARVVKIYYILYSRNNDHNTYASLLHPGECLNQKFVILAKPLHRLIDIYQQKLFRLRIAPFDFI